ncbi:MAG TPA: LuxR C-terminal-related transcriptional regulator [Bacteroidia bacterium]|nr:LuxR C-terminal-related transcriptional regulator [Bacteroidia bacterium]
MADQKLVDELFFKYLMQFEYEEGNLDYSLMNKHKMVLQTLSEIGNSGIGVFDVSKRQMAFYSSNFGKLLGYGQKDYEKSGQEFFYNKIHPEDRVKLSVNGISVFKIFNNFSKDDKLSHKAISEYRMLNVQNKYVRLIEQYQVLELDKTGQLWLLINFVDLSPNQEDYDGIKSQLLNFKTGQIIAMEATPKVQIELTKRETEILKLVKDGLLSKEISDKLAISVHTVNTHRQRFLEKLGANNSFEAVLFGSKFGLLN